MSTFTVAAAYCFVGYVAVTIAFYVMSLLRIQYAGFIARALAIYISLMVVAMYGVFASLLLRLVGQGGNAQWATARAFKWVGAMTTGILFTIEDPHGYLTKTRPAIFIGNHQTELDVLMLGSVFPQYCSQTAKSSLKWVPALGWFMSLSGTIFLDRKNSKDARHAMAGAADEIRTRKQSVYIFPEGTRSYSKEPMLLPFKKGAFHLAVQAGVPIVPIVVANYSHILWIRGLVFNSGKIPCKVLDPIPTAGMTPADVDDLTRSTRDLMLKELVALTAKARGEPMKVPAPTAEDEVTIKASGREVRDKI